MMYLVIIFLPNPNFLVTRIKVLLVSQTLGQGTGKIDNITDSTKSFKQRNNTYDPELLKLLFLLTNLTTSTSLLILGH